MQVVPVITVDGPSGTGKGTIAMRLAVHLKWHYLDSGALYRTTAWAMQDRGVLSDDRDDLMALLDTLDIQMQPGGPEGSPRILCDTQDISTAIRTEDIGLLASQISSNPLVRKALFSIQQACRRAPGLVTDGRDMGTVVFTDAVIKLFLTASAHERALRRAKQLQQRGINGNLRQIEADLVSRDERDRTRAISPTKPAEDAVVIDTTDLSIDQVMAKVVEAVNNRLD